MKILSECSFKSHEGREKLEELCSLFAIGGLSPEEQLQFERHLKGCAVCQLSVKEFEKIMLFDLATIAASHTDELVWADAELVDEKELLAKMQRQLSSHRSSRLVSPSASISRPHSFIRTLLPAAGWSFAAALLLWIIARHPLRSPSIERPNITQVAHETISGPQEQIRTTEIENGTLRERLNRTSSSLHGSEVAYSNLKNLYQALNDTDSALKLKFQEEQVAGVQKASELDLLRNTLNEQLLAKAAIQQQLSEASSRLQKQVAETARFERAVSAAPARFPVSTDDVGSSEAKEILGARDLHIVDVYDTDDAGKGSRAYGRIYYVNRNQLVFYAFDLPSLERNHKAVAFQVWGFRQPQSSTVESLGLFFMDNAVLNRWTLRVSDPQILSRIDTLFVTVEPPGGSRFPKGKRLLMASLAGPPNHP